MNKTTKKLWNIMLSIVMFFSLLSGLNIYETQVLAQTGNFFSEELSDEAGTTPITIQNPIGNVVINQTKLNETNLTINIENVNTILSSETAEQIKISAKMYYGDTVTQNLTKIIPLQNDKTEYIINLENFGKYSVTIEYLKNNISVSASETITVGIAASEYNLALINATFPVTLFSLSLWDGTDCCITKDTLGNPIPTIAIFERLAAWDWNSLPENVYKLPTAPASDYNGKFADWGKARNQMIAYVKDLYEISPNAFFHYYSTDNYIENMLMVLTANQIPESQYRVVLLSDGSGTYSIFNKTFQNDADGSLYADMCNDWTALKQKTYENGYFDASWAKYPVRLNYQCLENYASIAAADDNIEWWVARTDGTFNISNQELLNQVKANCTIKNLSGMLKAVQDAGKSSDFQKLYHFDNDMFSEASRTGKPVMLILGSKITSEKNFKDYAKMAMEYYGDTYAYYYKGHPGTPTSLYPSKQQDLDELDIIDVDSSIPAELIMFFFPDIYICGYNSTTFQSVESDEMACGMFNMTKATGLTKTYGEMLDFFATPINSSNTIYSSLCTEPDHTYYLLEFNDTKDCDIAIYDASKKSFTYYKNIADSGYQWSNEVLKNITWSDINLYEYTGTSIKPEITLTWNNAILQEGSDYSISYGENILPCQGSITVEGMGSYAGFGSAKKFFSINKASNPLEISCADVTFGNEPKPNINNPSQGKFVVEYKVNDDADISYSSDIPTEPGTYTIRVTSEYTNCYNSATATAEFSITKAIPVIKTLPKANAITAGQNLSTALLSGGQADVDGTFQWKNPDITPSTADSGKTIYTIVFTPLDTKHYETIEAEIAIVVNSSNNSNTGTITYPTTPGTIPPSASPDNTMQPSIAPSATPGSIVPPSASPSATPDSTTKPTAPPENSVPPSAAPTSEAIKQGQKITIGHLKYTVKIVTNKSKTTSLKLSGVAANKKTTQINVPSKVTYKGKSYKVTEICANTFSKNKHLTKITIGKSITKIGDKAFYKCKKLKKIIVKSENISFIGKNAFKGIHKKAAFKLPAKKKKQYKKKIRQAGFNL